MPQPKSRTFLVKTRGEIGAKVRALRQSRKWSQAELARHLELSQNRLSEIERGAGSFSAEQLLLLLKLFNVSASHFVDQAPDPTLGLQNALARFGASHLQESDVLPAEQLDVLGRVVREVLVDGSPRFITALAPILVRNARQLNLSNVQVDLSRLGFSRRLPWVVENILEATKLFRGGLPNRLVLKTSSLQLFLNYFTAQLGAMDANQPPDVLDPGIRTPKTVQQVQRSGSTISQRWGVVSTLQPADFVDPLKVLLGRA
jgi:transcriptional regulator with XRE-family HTH domain